MVRYCNVLNCQTVGRELRWPPDEQSHSVERWQGNMFMWDHGRSGETCCGFAIRTCHFAIELHATVVLWWLYGSNCTCVLFLVFSFPWQNDHKFTILKFLEDDLELANERFVFWLWNSINHIYENAYKFCFKRNSKN